jgi:tetratricopeptide (TPR) repeat protein
LIILAILLSSAANCLASSGESALNSAPLDYPAGLDLPAIQAMSPILYRAPDFLVRFVEGRGSSICVVTFSSLTDDPRLDRPGFGEMMLKRHGFDAIHVVNRTNVWYQYPEIPDALHAIALAAAGHSRIVTYGSSMGDYAAIRFAGAIGARTAIAISPQYSVSPRIAPFETRWPALTRNIQFIHENADPKCDSVEPVVFYDPRDRDARHFRLIERAYPKTQGVRLPHAGHPAGAFLIETGLLARAVLDIANGRFEPPVLERTARARRRSSGQYLFTLARRLPQNHLNTKIRLAEMAARATDDASYHIFLGVVRESAGDFAAAETQLEKANLVLPDHPVPVRALCAFLLRRSRYKEAVPLARKLVATDPLRETFALLLLAAHLGNRDFASAARAGCGPVIKNRTVRILSAAALDPLNLGTIRPLLLAYLTKRVRLHTELANLEERPEKPLSLYATLVIKLARMIRMKRQVWNGEP